MPRNCVRRDLVWSGNAGDGCGRARDLDHTQTFVQNDLKNLA